MMMQMDPVGGDLKSDAFINKGGLVRTLSVCDPSLKRKRLIVNVALLDLFFLNGVLLFVGLFLTPSLLWVMLAIIPIMSVITIFQHLLLKSVLMRGAYPVTLYSNGFEFPSFVFNRMIRRPEFIKREDVASISVSGFSQGARADEMRGLQTIYFKTRSGKTNDTGARSIAEVESAIEWIEKNWGLKVERKGLYSPSAPQTAPHVAKKVSVRIKYCPQCGKGSDSMLNFCPFCGVYIEPEASPETDAKSGQWQVPSTPPYNPYQRAPAENYQTPPVGSAPMNFPNGKSPRKAFIIGLGLGFFGLMGIGHLYMEKTAKGIVLLIVGGFLATISLFSWLAVMDMPGYTVGVRIVTALVMSAPYLTLQIWQALDAPKPKKERIRGR